MKTLEEIYLALDSFKALSHIKAELQSLIGSSYKLGWDDRARFGDYKDPSATEGERGYLNPKDLLSDPKRLWFMGPECLTEDLLIAQIAEGTIASITTVFTEGFYGPMPIRQIQLLFTHVK